MKTNKGSAVLSALLYAQVLFGVAAISAVLLRQPAAPTAVDQIVFGAPTLAGFDVICTAPTVETVRVSIADDGVSPASALEGVVLGGAYQSVGAGVADLRDRQGRPGERHHHKPYNRYQDGHPSRHSLTSFAALTLPTKHMMAPRNTRAILRIVDIRLCKFA